MNSITPVPTPKNERVKMYAPGSTEREAIKTQVGRMLNEELEIPLIIGGKEIRTGSLGEALCPHDHKKVLARYHKASAEHVAMAADAAKEAWHDWQAAPWEARVSVFMKAAELLAGPWRMTLNAATMLNQSKTVHQAEIDSACELIDFYRFNTQYARTLYEQQPDSGEGIWNRVEHRPLEGFIFAVTPFNFTAIAGNLPTAPAMMGNVALWKPASSAVYSGYWIMRLLEEAGLPPGVINFLPGSGSQVGNPVMGHPDLAGVHFTGSTSVFQDMWKTVGENIARYKSYPRIVGETGGKDFIFAHPSADIEALSIAMVRGAFEYQGQKCSAASRAFIPESVWNQLRDPMLSLVSELKVGPVTDMSNFMGAVIDKNSYDNIKSYIEHAKSSPDAEILVGGDCDESEGYFIEPTVVLAKSPDLKLMREEIFGPVLTVYVYPDNKIEDTLHICDTGSPYALTGAIFSQDRHAIVEMTKALRYAAGNFYINDKPTGAVVNQQPFGGGRASGTNDKAGSILNLQRWVSPRTIKETFVPPKDYRYPYMK